MSFYRYRQNFSSGPGSWKEIEHYSEKELTEELNHQYEWSEHYRGCEIEAVRPSKEFLESEIKRANISIKSLAAKIKRYEALIKE